MTRGSKRPYRPLPTVKQAAVGVELAMDNAWAHILCAQALNRDQHVGAAVSHLIYAVEEAVKARVLHRWANLKSSLSVEDLQNLLYMHQVRHGIAESESMPQTLRREVTVWVVDHPRTRMSRQALTRLFARHPEAFPITWAKNADRERQRGMHVDWDGRRWKTPAQVHSRTYARRFGRCLEFVVKTSALVGRFDEIKSDLLESGWDIRF